MNKIQLSGIIAGIILVVLSTLLAIPEINKQTRINELNTHVDEIKQEGLELTSFIHNGQYSPAYVECEQETSQYGTGLIPAMEYRTEVIECFSHKISVTTQRIEALTSELKQIQEELRILGVK